MVSGGRVGVWLWPHTSIPPGSENTAQTHVGSLGTWEILVVSVRLVPDEGTGYAPLALGLVLWTDGSENTGTAHGIAKRRKRSAARGTEEVAHLHSTVASGEPVPRGPWVGKGDVRHGLVGGTLDGGFEPRFRVHVTLTDSKAGR